MGMRIGDRCPIGGCNATIARKAGEAWEDNEPAGFTDNGWRMKFQTWVCSRGHSVLEQLSG